MVVQNYNVSNSSNRLKKESLNKDARYYTVYSTSATDSCSTIGLYQVVLPRRRTWQTEIVHYWWQVHTFELL